VAYTAQDGAALRDVFRKLDMARRLACAGHRNKRRTVLRLLHPVLFRPRFLSPDLAPDGYLFVKLTFLLADMFFISQYVLVFFVGLPGVVGDYLLVPESVVFFTVLTVCAGTMRFRPATRRWQLRLASGHGAQTDPGRRQPPTGAASWNASSSSRLPDPMDDNTGHA
jgi:hypothetical protein